MRTLLFMAAVVVILAACSRSPVEPEGLELLMNGDVEEGLVRPAHWGYFNSPYQTSNEYVFRWEHEVYRSPSHSLRISLDSASDPKGFASWYQNVPIEPGTLTGKTLRLTSFIKLMEVTGNSVCLVIRADYPSGELAGFATTQNRFDIKGTKDWSSYSVELDDLSEGSDEIWVFILLGSGTTGTVYFDDISLIAKD